MHLSPLFDEHIDCTLIGALRRLQCGLVATLLAIAAAFVLKGLSL